MLDMVTTLLMSTSAPGSGTAAMRTPTAGFPSTFVRTPIMVPPSEGFTGICANRIEIRNNRSISAQYKRRLVRSRVMFSMPTVIVRNTFACPKTSTSTS